MVGALIVSDTYMVVRFCVVFRVLKYVIFQDKILQSVGDGGKITITNDGATILKAIPVDNAAAKILVDIRYFCV